MLQTPPRRTEPRPQPLAEKPEKAEKLDKNDKPDARVPVDAGSVAPSLEGSGEPLCRALLELVLADRAGGGPPCSADRVPVFADLRYAAGGGLVIEADDLREVVFNANELSLVPAGGRLAAAGGFSAAPDAPSSLLSAESLASLRARGDVGALELQNRSAGFRTVVIDGVPVAALPPGRDLTLSMRTARYVLDWRNAIGEASEPPSELGVPGKASSARKASGVEDAR